MDPQDASSQPDVPTPTKSPGNVTREVTGEDQLKSLVLEDPLAGIDDGQPHAWLDDRERGQTSSANKTEGLPSKQNATPTVFAAELSTSRDKIHVFHMASDLRDRLKPFIQSKDILDVVSNYIPDKLRTFARMVADRAVSDKQREVAFIVRRNREEIQTLFTELFRASFDDERQEPDPAPSPPQFLMRRFLDEASTEYADDLDPPQPAEGLEAEDEEPGVHGTGAERASASESNAGQQLGGILKTWAYDWLVSTLLRIATHTIGSNMEGIGDFVRQQFIDDPSPSEITHLTRPRRCHALILLAWDPFEFVAEEKYSEPAHEAIGMAITLTGAMGDAQALTTEEYLRQVWPKTGEHTMNFIKERVSKPKDEHVRTSFPDGTMLASSFFYTRKNRLMIAVGVEGISDMIIEVVQQLSWICAALDLSFLEYGVSGLKSVVLRRPLPPGTKFGFQEAELVCFVVTSRVTTLGDFRNIERNGECWQHMFKNPVLVQGFPILRKREENLGLEMPLNMMAGLLNTDKAVEFKSHVFIKGFAIMLVATRIARDILLWHFVYNSEREEISYLDNTADVSPGIDISQIESFRHVIGWCKNAYHYTGDPNADYNIQRSELPSSNPACILDRATISAGKYITAGASFAIAVKDVSRYSVPNSYLRSLDNLREIYAVMWDCKTNQGWLVNGTSALLHLVMTWLQRATHDDRPSSAHFLFDLSQLNLPPPMGWIESAGKILSDPANRELLIYPGSTEISQEEEQKTKQECDDQGGCIPTMKGENSMSEKKKRGYVILEDIVQDFMSLLFQIFQHQKDRAGKDGYKLKMHTKRRLEGWDLVELVSHGDPTPLVAELDQRGYGWVDFIRSLNAVTLFGYGFGDLIIPERFEGMCPKWTTLPPDSYYLAMSARELQRISENRGITRTEPPQPVRGLVWHCPGDILASCEGQCEEPKLMKRVANKLFRPHNDPVQVFYPLGWHKCGVQDGSTNAALYPNGAVVFGQNSHWKYRYTDDGMVEEQPGVPRAGMPVDAVPAVDNGPVFMSGAIPVHRQQADSDISTVPNAPSVSGYSTRSDSTAPTSVDDRSLYGVSTANLPRAGFSQNTNTGHIVKSGQTPGPGRPQQPQPYQSYYHHAPPSNQTGRSNFSAYSPQISSVNRLQHKPKFETLIAPECLNLYPADLKHPNLPSESMSRLSFSMSSDQRSPQDCAPDQPEALNTAHLAPLRSPNSNDVVETQQRPPTIWQSSGLVEPQELYRDRSLYSSAKDGRQEQPSAYQPHRSQVKMEDKYPDPQVEVDEQPAIVNPPQLPFQLNQPSGKGKETLFKEISHTLPKPVIPAPAVTQLAISGQAHAALPAKGKQPEPLPPRPLRRTTRRIG